MSTHANMVKMTVTSVGADPYTITLNAASSGYQSFADAYGANATVDILITMGTTWEVARNCTYTNSGTTVTRGTFEDSSTGSRITTFDNTAVVSVVATADSGRRWDAAALTYVAATVTTGNVTGVVNTMHGLDIDGMTAARDFVLPTAAATGDRVGVFCTTDAPTTIAYVLQIKSGAAGDLINGTDHSSTIWSSLFIKGECLIFRCIDGSTVDWVVEYDGRIPMQGCIELTTASDGNASDTYYRPTQTSTAGAWTAITNVGDVVDTSIDAIYTRRSCNVIASVGFVNKDAGTTGAYINAGGFIGGSTEKINAFFTLNVMNTGRASATKMFAMTAGQYLQYKYRTQDSNIGAALTATNYLTLTEVL